MTRYGVTVDYDYNETHVRHRLQIWSGDFFSDWEGTAVSVKDGYIIRTYDNRRIRVTCPSPRSAANYHEVDAAISAAMNSHVKGS